MSVIESTQYVSPMPEDDGLVSRSRSQWFLSVPIVVGLALIGLAYQLAPSDTGFAHYDVFWLGMCLVYGPLFWLAFHSAVGDRLGRYAVVLGGILAYVPRFMHAPDRAYMNDEFGHILQADNLFRTGRLYQSNPIISQAKNFPGLETLTVGLRQLTGFSTYRVGTVLIALVHVLSVLAVYQIAKVATAKSRPAAIAALLFAVSPQFSFFDSMYSYESIGMPLLLWGVAAAVSSLGRPRRERNVLLSLTFVIGLASIITHHLTSYVLILSLGVVGIVVVARRWRDTSHRVDQFGVLGVAAGLAVVGALWAWYRHAGIVSYLDYFVTNGVASLWDKVTGQHVGGGAGSSKTASRSPFTNANIPLYEIGAAVASQFILLAGSAYAVWRARARLFEPAVALVVVLALAYFASLPFLFSSLGQNAAHRSWAFTFLGVDILVAWSAHRLLGPEEPPEVPVSLRARRRERWTRSLFVGAALVVLVGGYGSTVNYLIAFPGPFVYQSDGRNVPNELYANTTWLATHGGFGATVLADYRTYVVMATYDDAQPVDPLLSADFVFPPADPSAGVIRAVRNDAQFVVVDSRMTSSPSSEGFYFGFYDPPIKEPLPVQSLAKLYRYRWLSVVHRSAHYTIFKVTP